MNLNGRYRGILVTDHRLSKGFLYNPTGYNSAGGIDAGVQYIIYTSFLRLCFGGRETGKQGITETANRWTLMFCQSNSMILSYIRKSGVKPCVPSVQEYLSNLSIFCLDFQCNTLYNKYSNKLHKELTA